jgi:hypothetical protein
VRWPGGRAASCTSNPLRRFGQLDHLQGLPLRKVENEYRQGSASGMRVGIKAVVDDSKLCESRHQLNQIDATPIVALPNFCFSNVVSASSHPGSKPAPCAVRDYSIPRTTCARRFQPPTLRAEERRWCVRQASFRTRSPGVRRSLVPGGVSLHATQRCSLLRSSDTESRIWQHFRPRTFTRDD